LCDACVEARIGAVKTEIIMKPTKNAFAFLAAAGILAAQPAMAASAQRTASSSDQSEHLAGVPSAAIPALIGILAVAIVAVVASSNGHNHHPASP
jgi:hypothetical protein